jgi:hypothetical protein
MTTPTAPIVGLRTDGGNIDQVQVACPYCGGRHSHRWYGETDGYRQPTCGAVATYRISIDTRTRINAMRRDFAAPDGVVGLVPLEIGFAFEVDGPDDVLGVILRTALGQFALWLPLPAAVGLAGRIVDIARDVDQLRLEYLKRLKTAPSTVTGAANAGGMG